MPGKDPEKKPQVSLLAPKLATLDRSPGPHFQFAAAVTLGGVAAEVGQRHVGALSKAGSGCLLLLYLLLQDGLILPGP